MCLFFMAVQLLDRECDLAINRVNIENGGFKLIANIRNILGAFHFFLAQFRDMDQAFNTFFDLEEDTKVSNRSRLAANNGPRSILDRN